LPLPSLPEKLPGERLLHDLAYQCLSTASQIKVLDWLWAI